MEIMVLCIVCALFGSTIHNSANKTKLKSIERRLEKIEAALGINNGQKATWHIKESKTIYSTAS